MQVVNIPHDKNVRIQKMHKISANIKIENDALVLMLKVLACLCVTFVLNLRSLLSNNRCNRQVRCRRNVMHLSDGYERRLFSRSHHAPSKTTPFFVGQIKIIVNEELI
jgi:hypothetical protein